MLHPYKCDNCEHSWVADDEMSSDATQCHVCSTGKGNVLTAEQKEICEHDRIPDSCSICGSKGHLPSRSYLLGLETPETHGPLANHNFGSATESIVDALITGVSINEFLGDAVDWLAGGKRNRPQQRRLPPPPPGPPKEVQRPYKDLKPVPPRSNAPRMAPSGSTPQRPSRYSITSPGAKAKKPATTPAKAPSAPTGGKDLQDIVKKNAKAHGVPLPIAYSLIDQESGWKPGVVSPKGAIGLTQVMPQYALVDYNKANKTNYGAKDLYNPDINTNIGFWYLKTRKGSAYQKAAAYYAGEAGARKGRGNKYANDVMTRAVKKYGYGSSSGPSPRPRGHET